MAVPIAVQFGCRSFGQTVRRLKNTGWKKTLCFCCCNIGTNKLLQELLNWTPKYKSFRTFMRRLGGENLPDPVKKLSKKEKASVLWLPGDDDEDLF